MSDENRPEIDFDRDVFEEKFGVWKKRFEKGGDWENNQVVPEKTYVFKLNNGKELNVLKYRVEDVAKPDYPYSDIWFFVAEIDGDVVGYSALSIMKDNGAEVKMSTGDICVVDKGLGVGGKLSRMRDVVLQECANTRGDIDYVLMEDENAQKINETLIKIEKRESLGDGSVNYRDQIEKMIVDRQRWLSLFGEGGKMGYKWDEDRENLYKRYRKGGSLPELDCRIEENRNDLRVELGIEKKEKGVGVYEPVKYTDADQRFDKSDFDRWPEGKLDKDGYKEKLKNLENRGFREYFPQITLTTTEFQQDAKFLTVQGKKEKVEAERILREIERETGKKWQLEVIVETYEQNQKKARVFVREKYGREALGEVASAIRNHLGGEYLLKRGEEGYSQDNKCWVIEALEEGDIQKARVDFEQQGDKWNKQLTDFLESWLFDEKNLSTRQRIKKWEEIDN